MHALNYIEHTRGRPNFFRIANSPSRGVESHALTRSTKRMLECLPCSLLRFKANLREILPSVTPPPPENPHYSSSASSLRILPRRRSKTTPYLSARQSISMIPRQLSRFLLILFLNISLSRKSTHSGTMPYSSTSSGGIALTSEAVAGVVMSVQPRWSVRKP